MTDRKILLERKNALPENAKDTQSKCVPTVSAALLQRKRTIEIDKPITTPHIGRTFSNQKHAYTTADESGSCFFATPWTPEMCKTIV